MILLDTITSTFSAQSFGQFRREPLFGVLYLIRGLMQHDRVKPRVA